MKFNADREQSYSQPLPSSAYAMQGHETVRERFLEFLDEPLGPFVASIQGTKSTATRKPRFFDLHLHPSLQLRRIVVVNDLPSKISEFCNKEFASSYLVHIPSWEYNPFEKAAGQKDRPQKARLTNEGALAHAYENQFGSPLSSVSSVLLFKLNTWSDSVFKYTLSVKDPGPLSNNAKPDGVLCVNDEHSDDPLPASLSLSEEDRRDIDLIIKHNLNRMVLWEFKNLEAGSKALMDKFVELRGDFTWTLCQRELHTSDRRNCGHSDHDFKGHVSVTGRKVGFDSELSFIQELVETNDADALVGGKYGMDINEEESYSTETITTENFNMMSPFTASSSAAPRGVSISGKLSIKGSEKVTKKKESAVLTSTARNRRLEAVKERQAVALIKSRVNKPVTEKPEKEDQMAQQLWAEGVKYDATYLVLNGGNYEIIGVRHRDSQTLYISEPLEVVDPIYKRTQLGLHILAYKDALDRARQAENLIFGEQQEAPAPPRFHSLAFDFEVFGNSPDSDETQEIINGTEEEVYQELLTELETAETFQVMLPKRLNLTNKYSNCTLQRPTTTATPTTTPSSSNATDPTLSSWTFKIDKELSKRVYAIQAQGDGSKSISKKLIIKLAFSTAEKQTLIHEYNCHTALAGTPFAVKTFGILWFAEQFPSPCGLLMEWAGEPLAKIVGKVKLQKANKKSFNDFAKEQLQALHTSEVTVNNQVHGNLQSGHVLFTEGGGVSFISFRRIPNELVEAEKMIEMGAIELL